MTIYGMKCSSGTYSSTMTHCNGTCMEFAFSLLLSFFLSAWIFSFSAFSASFTLFFSSFIFLLPELQFLLELASLLLNVTGAQAFNKVVTGRRRQDVRRPVGGDRRRRVVVLRCGNKKEKNGFKKTCKSVNPWTNSWLRTP